ncbi:MAG TPA: sugar phosphate isomerase/epimerase [Solirubrobacteraceae bacterium]
MEFKFAVDLISFYHPEFWEVQDHAGLERKAAEDPRGFWEHIALSAQSAGFEGLELTFAPGDWQTAEKTFGSAAGLAGFLAGYGLSVSSGFFGALEYGAGLTDPGARQAVLDETRRYAAFLKEAGAEILVAGMPMRRRGTPDSPVFVDFDYARTVADLINRVGAAAQSEGVRVALHTEVGSVFCVRRDIDLFLSLTDPSYVDLCPDTAHIQLGGVSPIEVLDHHYERVSIAHWKDAVGRWPNDDLSNEDRFTLEAEYFRRVGTGDVDWGGWLAAMDRARFEGWTILELDAARDPVTDMRAAREFVEGLVAVA